MAIPDEIKSIERPKCTEVRFISNHYYVYKYTCVYDKAKKKNKKKTLGCIGKITLEDGFIPNKSNEPEVSSVRCLEYGAFTLVNTLCSDIRKQLLLSFPSEFNRIFVIAMMRFIYGCGFSGIGDFYMKSSASDAYDVSLSKNTITAFLSYLGNHREKIMHFMKRYIGDSHQLLIDGTHYFVSGSHLDIAKKGRNNNGKSQPQITLLYAFDKNSHMPGYYRVLPGNIVDQVFFENMIEEMGVKDCMFVADNSQRNVNILRSENIDYIIPLKITLKLVADYLENRDDNSYDGFFMYHHRVIWYKKHKKNDHTYIYQYLDAERKTQLEKSYMGNIVEEKENYSMEEFQNKRKNMGVFYFLSNLDMSCEEIYLIYKGRWEIETMFDAMKNTLGLGEIHLSNRIEVEGWAFINHIVMMMYYRIYMTLKENNLLKRYSVSEIISHFKTIQKVKLDERKYVISEMTKKEKELATQIGLKPELFKNNLST